MERKSSADLLERIERLNAIGIDLSTEKDFDRLLETILAGAREITRADGGTLYILEENRLRFELLQTATLGIAMGGTSGRPVSFSPLSLHTEEGHPNTRMAVTRAVLEDRLINIPDAYASDDYDFSGTRDFDARTGYRSRSILVVPMKDHEGRTIGALQLINATDPESGEPVPFSASDERLVASLASQAAIALTRKRLLDDLKHLLDSLIRLIATAIDEKSPYTGEHCKRVPVLTLLLADAVNRDRESPFDRSGFDEKEMYELEIAAWLHDCGKITTPEHIADKRTKLETISDRIHLIEARLEIIRRDIEIEILKRQLQALREGREGEIPRLESEMKERFDRLEETRSFLRRCNEGGEFLSGKDRRRIEELSRLRTRPASGGAGQSLLDPEDVSRLTVSRGTLTSEEREIINAHILTTIRLLETLPFPEHLKNVPGIAGGHHEKMDGSGYPKGLAGGELPLQARILAIADIFEALTAGDRPYRKANTLSEALRIMEQMRSSGHIDPHLFDLFVREGLYLEYARKFLRPEQIDLEKLSDFRTTGAKWKEGIGGVAG